jgi:ubiquinone/menaquinone biosynthesis C-methylase UbiE
MFHRLWSTFLRLAFHLLYNPLASTYDWVSAIVSRGHWRAWTRTAIPHLVGTRVLEIPCGTGNLLLDLCSAGYAPIGVDLSASMLRITRGKLLHAGLSVLLLRTRAQALAFPDRSFDSIVMTFPPGFVYDPNTWSEFHRVLADDGRLIWVDAARLLPHDAWSRLLNRGLNAVGASGMSFADFALAAVEQAGFEAHVEMMRDNAGSVMIVIASKRHPK